jgi:hypothetical protein
LRQIDAFLVAIYLTEIHAFEKLIDSFLHFFGILIKVKFLNKMKLH